jgi:translation initiation factor IF-3
VTFKEVRLTPKIGSGDFDTKVHRAIEFLEDGDRIKVTVRFRGRELTHPELGRNMLARFTDRIKEHGTPERAPLLEGKSMHLTVASLHKPKEHDVAAKPPRPESDEPAAGTEPAAPAKPARAGTEPAVPAKPARAAAKPARPAEPPPVAPAAASAAAPANGEAAATPEQNATPAEAPTPPPVPAKSAAASPPAASGE